MFDPITALKKFIRFPSVSTDSSYRQGLEDAQKFITDHLQALDFTVKVFKTDLHPIITATRGKNPKWPHIVLYAHYDVQPADPFDLWKTDPFEGEIIGNRIYGRGACDNKGPFIAQLAALDRVLSAQPDLPLRITFIIEGEEEIGSPSFPKFLESYKKHLEDAKVILISDTVSATENQAIVTTAIRGIIGFEVEVTGAKTDLHSGFIGGAVMNPIRALTHICSSLHDENGLVNIPGFYDDVVPPQLWEKEELKRFPLSEADFKKTLDIPELCPPKGYTAYEAIRFGPTLEFNGIGGGYQGPGSKTIVPSKASAKITFRLVPNQDPEKIATLVTKTLSERSPKGVSLNCKVNKGGAPYWVIPPHKNPSNEPSSEFLKKVFLKGEKAIEEVFGTKPLYLREGGSIPIISLIKKVTGLDSWMFGIVLPQDTPHAPNESFDLGMLEKGIQVYEKLFNQLASK